MKKYVSLFVLSILFFSGVSTAQIAEKYSGPGRHIWNKKDALVEDEQELKNIARVYRITENVRVAVIGNNTETVVDTKEIFSNFGFQVVQDNYKHTADYVVEIQREDQQDRYSGTYGYYNYSNNNRRVSGVRLIVFDAESKTERYYTGTGEYKYAHYYWGYYYHNYYYQTDPGRMSSKIAIMVAIAEFIDGEDIPHHIPQKKR